MAASGFPLSTGQHTFHRNHFLFSLLVPAQFQLPSLFFSINLPLFLGSLSCLPVRNSAQNSVFLSRVPCEVLTIFGTLEAAEAVCGDTHVPKPVYFLSGKISTNSGLLSQLQTESGGHGPAQPPNTCSERALKMRGYPRSCPWVTSSNLAVSEPLDPTMPMDGGEGLS